jgi:glycerophosphoryl diester phosphodiesterase
MKLTNSTQPLILGHRGASGYAPENTRAAFLKALEMGADGVELDVQLTKDGVLIVNHDEWIDRTSDGHGWIKDFTYEELKQFNFNRNFPEYGRQQIMTLAEVFDIFKPAGKLINIELKTGVVNYPGIVRKTVDLVREYGMEKQVFYSSFNHYTCLSVKKMDPEAYVGFLVSDTIIHLPDYCLKHKMDAVHPALYLVQDTEFVKECHQKGLDINVWTVNEPEHLEMARQLHLTTIITNYPDRARSIVLG